MSMSKYILLAFVLLHRFEVVHGLLPTTISGRARHHSASSSQLHIFDDLFSGGNKNQYPKVELPSDFTVPEPRPLTITESTDIGAFTTASAGLALRLATGAFVLGWKVDTIFAPDDGKYSLKLGPLRLRDSSSVLDQAKQPAKTIILYDNESSPRCKRVREMMNLLDITYECRPSFSDVDKLPYIDDPNVGKKISGDNDIIEHLLEKYGPPSTEYDRKALWPITFQEFALVTSQVASLIRGNPGKTQQPNARPDNNDMQPIELWAYECSPFVRPVKEKLSALGLPHVVVSCSRGSTNRDRMVEKTGRFQVPYIVDGNTGIDMFEGPEIVEYLEAVYTVKE